MKKLKKKNLLILTVLVVLFLTSIVFYKNNYLSKNVSTKKVVTTSFYPLYYFTSEIGGDRINVVNITPAGAEPHDYELSTGDVVNVQISKLLVLNGANLEPWGDKIKNILSKKNIPFIETANGLAHVNGFEDKAAAPDPHVWLDPVFAKVQSSRILEALISVDPENKDYYSNNFKTLSDKLETLNQDYKNGLSNCKQKNIVTSHEAFTYLADRYGFTAISIAGLSPDSEPSIKQLANITNLIRKNNIKYIFYEELISPKLSETIASETNTKTLSFNPLEGLTAEDKANGEDYISIQEKNLTNLRIALSCS